MSKSIGLELNIMGEETSIIKVLFNYTNSGTNEIPANNTSSYDYEGDINECGRGLGASAYDGGSS